MDIHQPFVMGKLAILAINCKVIVQETVAIELIHVVSSHTLSRSKSTFTDFLECW